MKKLLLILIMAVGMAYSSISSYESYYVGKGTEIIQQENKKIDELTAREISYYVYRESQKHDIDFHFALGIMTTESRFNVRAKSYCGAIGLMQIMPSTAKYIAKIYDIEYTDLYDTETNIQIGMAYLARLKDRFGSYELTAAGYNGGNGGAKKYKEYLLGERDSSTVSKETRKYVPKVMNYAYKYRTYNYEYRINL